MECNCPDSSILGDIGAQLCPFDMKQIQALAFVKKGQVIWDSATGGGLGNGVPSLTAQVDTLADWIVLTTAIDDTHAVVTPRIGGDPIIVAGGAITSGGGDNSSMDGVEEVSGVEPSKFTCVFKSLPVELEVAMKAIKCHDVEVYFFLQGGRIACSKPDPALENIKGFNLSSYFFGDRDNQGFGTKDTNMMSFSLPEGWSETLQIITPLDFNPIYDLH